jgi:hypothetical protein
MTWGNATEERILQQRLDAECRPLELAMAEAFAPLRDDPGLFAMTGLYGQIPGTDTAPIPMFAPIRRCDG